MKHKVVLTSLGLAIAAALAMGVAGCGSGATGGAGGLLPTTAATPTPTVALNAVEPGSIRVIDGGIEIMDQVQVPQDGEHKIISLGMAAQVTAVGGATQFTQGGVDYGPAPGEQLTVVSLEPITGAKTPEGETTVAAVIGTGEPQPMEITGPTTLVYSAPAGAAAELRFDCDGVRQTLDLATGKRTSTVAEGFYVGKGSISLAGDYRKSVKVKLAMPMLGSSHDTIEAAIVADSAVRSPYLADYGWAPDGGVWIRVTLSTSELTHSVGLADEVPMSRDASKVELVADGGESYSADMDKSSTDWWSGGSLNYVFAVPAAATKLKLELTPGANPNKFATKQTVLTWPTMSVPVDFE